MIASDNTMMVGHRVLLLYRLDGPEAVRPLVDRKARTQVPVDVACTVLASREMATPGFLGAFIGRARILRMRGPVQVLAFDEGAAFPAAMAADADAPAVQVSAVGLDRAALARVAGRVAEGVGPATAAVSYTHLDVYKRQLPPRCLHFRGFFLLKIPRGYTPFA